jgi:hypothetical protein
MHPWGSFRPKHERLLFLHDNAQPHTSLRTSEAIAKMGWTVLSHSPYSPHTAPSDYHLFDPVRVVLRERHFADELKQSFRDVLRSRSREFYNTVVQCLTKGWQKCVENGGHFVEKLPHNCKNIRNHPYKFYSCSSYVF